MSSSPKQNVSGAGLFGEINLCSLYCIYIYNIDVYIYYIKPTTDGNHVAQYSSFSDFFVAVPYPGYLK